ncbi:hypothetical protein K0M31_010688 [Melipona bicolor]|uniref:Uncharacterized protein n=1 Tax=Melipona bicolor TaxID=60889 RepID=A0AA40FKP4_9HYME|nr:hypothetical protein K0M31_010688 [Melipona bicolor]
MQSARTAITQGTVGKIKGGRRSRKHGCNWSRFCPRYYYLPIFTSPARPQSQAIHVATLLPWNGTKRYSTKAQYPPVSHLEQDRCERIPHQSRLITSWIHFSGRSSGSNHDSVEAVEG